MTDAPSHTDLPACPPWCSSPAGTRTPEAVDGSYVTRYHKGAADLGAVVASARSASFSGLEDSAITATIDSEEQAVSDNGAAVKSAPRLTLWAENYALTALEAREVAALLCRAADRLEAITAR